MGFANIRQLGDAAAGGQLFTGFIRKIPSQASVANWWADLSMASGQPVPNYYASTPLKASVLDGFRGMFHGDDRAPAETFIASASLTTPTANMVGAYKMMDYLVYYPFVDMDDADAQVMDNTTVLPRYADGEGVMVMAVAVAPTVGGGSFTFNYIDQDGNPQTSPVNYCGTTAASIASIVTSQPATAAGFGPFLRLANGSRGVRSITSLTMSVLNGGLVALVLVKPLFDITIHQVGNASEMQFVGGRSIMPRIYDGAYLNMICNTVGTIAAGQLMGRVTYVWN